MRSHRGPGWAAQHLVAEKPPVEELEQRLVVPTIVAEHELLERGVTVLPRRRAPAQQRDEIVEVGLGDLVADLVETLEVTRQPERDANLVTREFIVDVERAQRLH